LVSLFVSSRPAPSSIKEPKFAYAGKVDDDDEKLRDASGVRMGTTGKRAQPTIAPIAEERGLTATLNCTVDKGDEAAMIASAMIASAMACPGVALVCWVHENIPRIANQIPMSSATPVPKSWPADAQGNGRFDVVWAFEFDNTTGKYWCGHIPRELLAGDVPEQDSCS
jgi:hypothetical protein